MTSMANIQTLIAARLRKPAMIPACLVAKDINGRGTRQPSSEVAL
mgnify:CR=1 FL=1